MEIVRIACLLRGERGGSPFKCERGSDTSNRATSGMCVVLSLPYGWCGGGFRKFWVGGCPTPPPSPPLSCRWGGAGTFWGWVGWCRKNFCPFLLLSGWGGWGPTAPPPPPGGGAFLGWRFQKSGWASLQKKNHPPPPPPPLAKPIPGRPPARLLLMHCFFFCSWRWLPP